ncbi:MULTISPECIES: hypothetical protein [Bradyrhizobium]|uniref:hypothetical protein n=1 Tax=Bradyrhizobium TaxID=374 RepID=UPI00117791FE|nr:MULTISPECIES: hypothetical protein [Bradyrhizobium]MCK1269121.1 hypothetical protein [Bradyrhizobium sp. 84]MCK1314061.1 hypothetical protein [Bradyrhizobium sp. 23]MCK1333009.1 hypothetical protein [Bradyrhizobium sp. CW9]MCK1353389.1 hypothetical protein [Bradyrhizobium sp. CW7]MCK1373717.1 hypothetical protein [Bradyrhizobium sp. 49]
MGGSMRPKTAAASLCFIAGYWLQAHAAAAGECALRPERFVLLSDTVYWVVSIPAGTECLQGLRGRTQLLDEVKLAEAPSAGHVTIVGPSFRYQAPSRPGTDRFRIAVSGENRRQRGSSIIAVEVTVR